MTSHILFSSSFIVNLVFPFLEGNIISYRLCCCYICRKDGNPFNTTIIPSAPALAPSPFAVAPVTVGPPTRQAGAGQPLWPGTPESSDGARSFFSAKRIIWIVIIGTGILVALGFCLLVSICLKRSKRREDNKSVRDKADMASNYKPKSMKPSVEGVDMEKGTNQPISLSSFNFSLVKFMQSCLSSCVILHET